MTTPRIIGRAEAKALGLKRYFTGKPCKHGHISERSVAKGYCVVCHSEAGKKNKERGNELRRLGRSQYREKHREAWEKYRERHNELSRLRYSQRRLLQAEENWPIPDREWWWLDSESVKEPKKRQKQTPQEKYEKNLLFWRNNPELAREKCRRHYAKYQEKYQEKHRKYIRNCRAAYRALLAMGIPIDKIMEDGDDNHE